MCARFGTVIARKTARIGRRWLEASRLDLSRARVFKTIETRPEAPTVIPGRRGSHMNLIDHSAVEELFLLDLAWCNCKANKRASPR